MRYKLGRIGVREAVCASAITMCVNGVFDIEPGYAYASGNSTYLSIPLSALASLAVFLCVCAVYKKTGAEDLNEFFRSTAGGALGLAFSLLLCVSLIVCAAMPLGVFTHVLDDLVYDGVEYPVLLAFLLPASGLIAFMGLETVGRTAIPYAFILPASLAAAFFISLPSQEWYRMYPVMGDGAAHLFANAASGGVCFLPPLAALLVFGKALQGTEHAVSAGIRASVITAAVCFTVQFMLARLYTYEGLSGIFMPLCRVNYLGVERSYVMWLDKLLVMTWLNGGVIAAAYCIYAAGLLYARAFGQPDATPGILLMTALTALLALLEFVADVKTAAALSKLASRYGALLSALPMAASAALGLIKTRGTKGGKAFALLNDRPA